LNVVVKDVIDEAKFDVNSLVPLSGSHPFQTRIKPGNIVEFFFENINLPFDDESNDGYVVFKIRTSICWGGLWPISMYILTTPIYPWLNSGTYLIHVKIDSQVIKTEMVKE